MKMEMKYYQLVIQYKLKLIIFFFTFYFFCFKSFSGDSTLTENKVISGYNFAEPSTQNMQDDDFLNPGILWVEQYFLWNKIWV